MYFLFRQLTVKISLPSVIFPSSDGPAALAAGGDPDGVNAPVASNADASAWTFSAVMVT